MNVPDVGDSGTGPCVQQLAQAPRRFQGRHDPVAASKSASSEAAVDNTAVSVKEPLVARKSIAELAPHRNGSEPDRTYDQLVSDAAKEIAESRGPIEHVKGMLMFVYRIDERQAWELLKWRSQETNVKLRALAVQLTADILALDYGENLPGRSSLDRLFMTAHLRVASSSEARVQGRPSRS